MHHLKFFSLITTLHYLLISLIVFKELTACSPDSSNQTLKAASGSDSTGSQIKKIGEASWYGPGFENKKTASGEIFQSEKLVAASPNLPLGSKVEVTNLENGRKTEVRINDRGPYAKGRILDLSYGAAKKLGMTKNGKAKVKVVAKRTPKTIRKK
jgi:rare lipoprotein A